MLYAGHILFLALEPSHWMGRFPSAFYEPPLSFARLMGGFPPEAFFHVLNVLMVVGLVFLFLGVYTRYSSIGVFVVSLVYTTFAGCFGNILHSTLIIIIPLVMAFSNWGAGLSWDAIRGKGGEVEGWPISLLSVLIGFCMFTAGVWKWEWLDLETSGIQSNLLVNYYARERGDLLSTFFVGIEVRWFWEVLDWVIVIFECLFLVVVFWPSWFRFWVSLAVLFHFANVLMLNVDFNSFLLLYMFFIPWELVERLGSNTLKAVERYGEHFYGVLKVWHIALLIFGILGVLYTHGSFYMLLMDLLGIESRYVLPLSLFSISSVIVFFFWVYRIRLWFLGITK